MQSSLSSHRHSLTGINVSDQVFSSLLVLDLPEPLDQLLHGAVVRVLAGDGLEDDEAGQFLVCRRLEVPLLLEL